MNAVQLIVNVDALRRSYSSLLTIRNDDCLNSLCTLITRLLTQDQIWHCCVDIIYSIKRFP